MAKQKTNLDKNAQSSTKHARGSKQVHSEKDNSTKDGFKPQGVSEEEE
ncbi:hypothetical protein ACFQ3R_09845 [Mesonia ostreae]|uniref:Uncharacterized protein n=1 Tax=Mesonia ostreae TaxID=861110 RepID=A0ABU2KED4_9FLAO|nr:hypothetical protein [Mesonia ostreae]MDT0293033.1 hypothetical protein [Mesonia ostreae]